MPGRIGAGGNAQAHAEAAWQPVRHWYMPRPHRLLEQAHGTGSGISIEGNPQQPAAAFLWQHQVQGRALLPGLVMVESCHAAVCMLGGASLCVSQMPCMSSVRDYARKCDLADADERSQGSLMLATMTIPAPFVLPSPAPPAVMMGTFRCCVRWDGSVELRSPSARRVCWLKTVSSVLRRVHSDNIRPLACIAGTQQAHCICLPRRHYAVSQPSRKQLQHQ